MGNTAPHQATTRHQPQPRMEPPEFLYSWSSFVTFGTLLTGLGIFMIVFTSLAFGGVKPLLTSVVCTSGVLYILLSLRISDWEGRMSACISGALYLAAGLYIARYVTSPELLAYILGPTVLLEGILLSAVSILLKLSRTWRWLLLSGSASILISFILVSGLSDDYRTITGLFAFNLITTGLAYNLYGFDLQRYIRDI